MKLTVQYDDGRIDQIEFNYEDFTLKKGERIFKKNGSWYTEKLIDEKSPFGCWLNSLTTPENSKFTTQNDTLANKYDIIVQKLDDILAILNKMRWR